MVNLSRRTTAANVLKRRSVAATDRFQLGKKKYGMLDVTEYTVTEHQSASIKPQGFRNIPPAASLTPHRERVLQASHGLRLAFVSKPLFYDNAFRLLNKRDHKTLLALLYGGWIQVFQVDGDLPGIHLFSRIGTRAGRHFLLWDKRQPLPERTRASLT